jgi:ketosteroid isomerase-like protein
MRSPSTSNGRNRDREAALTSGVASHSGGRRGALPRVDRSPRGLEVRSVIVDGDHACALTQYDLQPPVGPLFQSHVAEVFDVRGGKITAFDIYFDSSPFPK